MKWLFVVVGVLVVLWLVQQTGYGQIQTGAPKPNDSFGGGTNGQGFVPPMGGFTGGGFVAAASSTAATFAAMMAQAQGKPPPAPALPFAPPVTPPGHVWGAFSAGPPALPMFHPLTPGAPPGAVPYVNWWPPGVK